MTREAPLAYKTRRYRKLERLCAALVSELAECETTYAKRLAIPTKNALVDLEDEVSQFLDTAHVEEEQTHAEIDRGEPPPKPPLTLEEESNFAVGFASGRLMRFLHCESVSDEHRAAAIREMLHLSSTRSGAYSALALRGNLQQTLEELRKLPPLRRPELRLIQGSAT